MAKVSDGAKLSFWWPDMLLLGLAFTCFNHACAEEVAPTKNIKKTVVVIWVDESGKAKRAQIQRSCGERNCDAAAIAVAMTWTFPPVNGDSAAQQAPRSYTIGVDVADEIHSLSK